MPASRHMFAAGSVTNDGALHAVLKTAFECHCGRSALFVVHRGAVTRCVPCDMDFQRTRAEAQNFHSIEEETELHEANEAEIRKGY